MSLIKKIFLVLLIIIIIGVSGLYIINNYIPPYQKEFVTDVLKKYNKSLKLDSVDFKKNKSIDYRILIKEEISPEVCNDIRCMLNEYLIRNTDCFLNQGYEINVLFYTSTGCYPNILLFSNCNLEEPSQKYEGLYYVKTGMIDYMYKLFYDTSKLSVFSDIKGMCLGDGQNTSDMSFLENMQSLEYINKAGGFNDNEKEQIHNILPNCVINDDDNEYYKEVHFMTTDEFAKNQVGNIGDTIKYYQKVDGYYNFYKNVTVSYVTCTKDISEKDRILLSHAEQNPMKNVSVVNGKLENGTLIKVTFTLHQDGTNQYMTSSEFTLACMDDSYKADQTLNVYGYGFPVYSSDEMTFYQKAEKSDTVYNETDEITGTIKVPEGETDLKWIYYCPDEVLEKNDIYFCISPQDNQSNRGVRIKVHDRE